ncbi:peptidylprolyl isomerase [Ideonella sp.]|uniref:peptidylprolyl isomerase n=1 Tax=Ideonella sp. TaxID=1929293 RepID=UPI002B465BE8|nr:peptidylprolyl isomerase [Ideonella sp.]HJV70054.1 peptidylprolyl isomerase [Ideonella sp.]
MDTTTIPLACVNGVALHQADELLDAETLRQRACTELLRQAAERAGLLAESADTGDAIEALLERELNVPEPGDEALRRHYEAHLGSHAQGEKLQLRHVLFAVTPGVDVQALRRHAEGVLLELRCAEPGSEAFARAAEAWSNCPSREAGGELGWLTREDCAPEFAREIFAADTAQAIGVLPRLVHSRFGLHVVEVRAREAGTVPAFDEVRGAVALALKQQAWVNALRQYLQVLAGEAELEGVSLQAAETPLVQ